MRTGVVRKIKVLYLITNLSIGGAEMMLYRMIGQLDRDRFEPAVVSLIDKSSIGEMIEKDYGIPVYAFGIKDYRHSLNAIYLLKNFINQWSPIIIHSHMVHANLLARLTRLFCRFPVLICTIHNIDENGRWKSARNREYFYRLTDYLCNLTSQVSQAGMEKYLKIKAVPAEKLIYLPNGIDVCAFQVDEKEVQNIRQMFGLSQKYIFLAIGSLTSQKDYPNLIFAFSEVAKVMPDSVLMIAGCGPLESNLKCMVKKIGMAEKVIFLVMRKDIPALLNAADSLVMSSAWEGMPLVILEAAASKLPVVVTDVGGNAEVVRDQESGYLVPPRDSEALAGAMIRLMQLPKARQAEMGLAGYNHVKDNYDIKKIIIRWQDIYLKLLEENSKYLSDSKQDNEKDGNNEE